MPHFIIDCSESILNMIPPNELLQVVYEAAESTGLFSVQGVGGIKVRLNPYKHYCNVESYEHFVHVFGNIMAGRNELQKRDLSERIVKSLKARLPSVEIISMNIRDFEKATYFNAAMLPSSENI